MKQPVKYPNLTLYSPTQPRYPNAADDRYFTEKAVNIITAIVSVLGFVCAMCFLLTL